ncbi:hypothetical protein [Cohnella nanjingensis]|uniref:Uncharacterized protein n=1 Tax=Cohnella nanjingensis TaxID=1387779 RepID=A0A7X0RUE5_9BACL|nr:hypothetical protein [Cohnella nanjingensis]MBB6672600.1 hypothetical protein [Cohnella nanjingensis]
MNPRLAMRESIKFILGNIGMDADVAYSVAEQMHEDHDFLEQLEEFVQEYLGDFGENYGL